MCVWGGGGGEGVIVSFPLVEVMYLVFTGMSGEKQRNILFVIFRGRGACSMHLRINVNGAGRRSMFGLHNYTLCYLVEVH